MSVSLEINLKDGKNTIKAIVTEADVQTACSRYEELQQRFPGGAPAPAARGKKEASAIDAGSVQAGDPAPGEVATAPTQNVVNINQQPNARTSKKLFAQQAINLNDLALLWASRASAAITEFRGLSPQQLVEKLSFRKPMAMMEVPELQEFIKLIQDTMKTYAANNADVKSFLKIIGVIDTLQTGSQEEWDSAKTAISAEDWAFLGQNKQLYQFCYKQLVDRRNMLQVAAAAEAV